jgi:hypothetical protein
MWEFANEKLIGIVSPDDRVGRFSGSAAARQAGRANACEARSSRSTTSSSASSRGA